MREMIEQYIREASALEAHSERLKELISKERDVDVKKELLLRKATVDIERYEILDDIRSMRGYLS